MNLRHLHIRNLRHLRCVDLNFHSGLNLIHGPNASGKTTLLEAVHMLSCGKSFRTTQLGHAVGGHDRGFLIQGTITHPDDREVHLGLEFVKGRGLRMRAQGQTLQRVSQLAAFFPVVAIHQESHRLITEGPAWRRRFMDWGLFHVEHERFFPTWKRYQKALRQRNRALRAGLGARDVQVWDEPLQEAGQEIDELRKHYAGELEHSFQFYLDRLLPDLGKLQCVYKRGWNEEMSLGQALKEGLLQDRQAGYTHCGIHRADLELRIDGVAARQRISRGQQKLLVSALYLAQAALHRQATGRPCVLLIDDVTAELDARRRCELFRLLQELEVQVLLTTAEPPEDILDGMEEGFTPKMFHVEQGRITEVGQRT